MEKLILEIPTIYRENDAIDFIEEFNTYNSDIEGDALLHKYTKKYGSWLIKLVSNCDLETPSKTYFLIRENDNKIIGIVTINLKLNKRLKSSIGNIRYSIRPTERGKGYSKILLYLTIKECKNDKINELLISCNRKKIPATNTVIALGGKFTKEKFIKKDNDYLDFYTLNVNNSLEKYKKIYE